MTWLRHTTRMSRSDHALKLITAFMVLKSYIFSVTEHTLHRVVKTGGSYR